MNIAKKHLYILMAFVLAVAGIVLVIGYGTTTPDTFGHSGGELMVTVGGVAKTLQSAIDGGDFEGFKECTTLTSLLSTGTVRCTADISCEAGWTMTGGGCQVGWWPDAAMFDYPVGNGWLCATEDANSNCDKASVYVRCCR
ncbi:MAG: hypothetical protein Q7J54_01545 [Candidatus Woesearchaeota archaeon]|nr:hypothetical protein [Candidatus Woesearchaeota archaeon]